MGCGAARGMKNCSKNRTQMTQMTQINADNSQYRKSRYRALRPIVTALP
jgi:hypothetical protein